MAALAAWFTDAAGVVTAAARKHAGDATSAGDSSVPQRLTESLAANRFQEVMDALYVCVDTARDPHAVDWCLANGYTHGHVCALYKLTRNYLKHQTGRVPCTSDADFGAHCALLLLLRTMQDVEVSERNLAKPRMEAVYRAIRDKARQWVAAFPAAALPPLPAACARLTDWVRRADTAAAESPCPAGLEHASAAGLPSPVWTTCFARSTLGATFAWGTPSALDVTAFDLCTGVVATRRAVAAAFVRAVAAQDSWDAVFALERVAVVGALP
jgi:hypothetical protein